MVDPITTAVVQGRLKSITEEMALTLLRTTRSPILSEGRDCATGLYDSEGRMLEQTEYTAILAFALQPSLKVVIEAFSRDISPGDVILHNDVFRGGNQLADVGIFKPIFFDNTLVAWSACKSHQADIGGGAPGGYNPSAREVWQEALRIPPLRIYHRGRLRTDVWELIKANVRFDEVVMLDLLAGIGACTVGERETQKLISRYNLEAFHGNVENLMAATEKRMRDQIENIPDGKYAGESMVAFDGVNEGKEYRVAVTVTVQGKEITFDFNGTDPQSPGYVNAPLHATTSAVILSFLMFVDPTIPHNDGMLQPVHMYVPEGSILNARYPAATSFGNHLANQVSDAIFRAMALAVPERACAGWNWSLCQASTGIDPRTQRPYVDFALFAQKGGSGATHGADGYDHIGTVITAGAMAAQDPEMYETQCPYLIQKFEYMTDSAGAGQWRGGLGTHTLVKLRGKGVKAVIFGQQLSEKERPFGLFGGMPGTLNKIRYIFKDGSVYEPKGHDMIEGLDDAILEQSASGGGGYGDPQRRPKDKLLEEVKDEIISPEKARDTYGIEIDPEALEKWRRIYWTGEDPS